MAAVSLTSIFIITIISLFLNLFCVLVLVVRTTTVIQQINGFDVAVATLFSRLNEVLDRFDGVSGDLEPINPIQQLIAQFLQQKMNNETRSLNNRDEMGQFTTIEAK